MRHGITIKFSKPTFGNLTRFHSATWQDSIPILLPLRDGFKDLRHDGMELHRTDAGNVVVIGIDGHDFRGFHFRIAGMTVLFFLAFAGQRQSCQVRCLL